MNEINVLSGFNNLSYLQPTSNSIQSFRGDTDGDSDGSGSPGQIGGGSNLMRSMLEALHQSVNSSAAAQAAADTSSATGKPQDILAALQAFTQNLLAVLHQPNGNTSGGDSDGDKDSSGTASAIGYAGKHRGMSEKLMNLMQQLSAHNQTNATGASALANSSNPLGSLKDSFQILLDALGKSQGASASGDATLLSFLQNLLQNINGGQDISGAVVNTTA